MASIVSVGSMAFDSIETPFGKVDKVLGGSVNYFSLAASHFVPVQCVSVIGEDFPSTHLDLFKTHGIDTAGIRKADGKTFHWVGKYGFDLNEAHTLDTQLNVFESFRPELPESYKDTPYVFLGNISPELQLSVLEQVKNPRFVGIDTMNFWIESQRDTLIEAISRCDCLLINEGEVRQLTQEHNIVNAARVVREWGPKILVVKRGEYGAVLFAENDVFGVPALPLSEVKDPTGAGDSFAGGFMGYMASLNQEKPSTDSLRRAAVMGSSMASFTVQDFSFRRLVDLNKSIIEDRYQKFVDLTDFSAL